MIRVVHLMRKPQEGFHSFERLFANIRLSMPEDIEIRCVHCPFPTRGFLPRLFNFIHAFFIDADVVHVTGGIDYLTPALIGRRKMLTIHDLAPLRPKKAWMRSLFRYLWYIRPLRSATMVTAVSESVRKELQQEFGSLASKVIVIPNCISRNYQFEPRAWPDIPTILMVGTRPQKNIERMCQAAGGLPVKVNLIGKLTPEQLSLLSTLDLSWTHSENLSDDAVLQAYRDCDLLAFASTYEGFGLPIIEAQVTGRPVLTSDRRIMHEVAGEGACFVDPEKIDSIRQGLERIITDTGYREHLVAQGFENAKRFLPTATAQAYAEAYRIVA